jgi:WD40 repeat protein
MNTRACLGFLCGAILLVLAVAGASAADPSSQRKKASRVDDIGDPLPDGAVARIGTVRLRQPSEICSTAYSPDGKLLATGGRYDGVRLWDSVTGKLLRFLPAQRGQGIFYISFSPDSKTLASSGIDGALEVWNVASGKKIQQLGRDSASLGPFCFSGDGKLLAVADGKTMRIWETARWTEQKSPEPEERKAVLASFAGKRIYVRGSGGERGKDLIWDVAALEKKLVPLTWRIGFWTALSPDGKRLAATDLNDRLVVVRDVETGKQQQLFELAREKNAAVRAICFSPDGKRLAIGGSGIQMRCVDFETGKETARFGDQEVDYATQVAFSQDGKRLAVARGRAIRLWDVGTGRELSPSSERLDSVQAVAFSPNGKRLVFGDGRLLRLYDVATRKEVWNCPEEWDNAQRLAFAPDGKTLAAGNVSRLRFLDALTGKVAYTWGAGLPRVPDHRSQIEFGLFTPDLEKVVSMYIAPFGSPGTDVFVKSSATGKELRKFQRRGEATAACLSPNGRLLAIGDSRAPIQLYNIKTGKWVTQLDATGTYWHSLVFAPDGRTLASMNRNGSLQLLEVATGMTRLDLAAAKGRREFAYSADGKILATWEDTEVELWDTLDGRKLGKLDGHGGRINQMAFMPGGSVLATASEDTTILIWDLADLIRAEKPMPLSPEALTSAWKVLADPNAAQACRAMASFRQAGPQAVDFLRERLRPVQKPGVKQIDRWLKDLDDASFTVRDRASQEIKKHIDVLTPTLQETLGAGPSLEMHRRLTQLIESAEGHWAPEALRNLRAIEILERIGSADAQRVLTNLAVGEPDARLTQQARASLERLAR